MACWSASITRSTSRSASRPDPEMSSHLRRGQPADVAEVIGGDNGHGTRSLGVVSDQQPECHPGFLAFRRDVCRLDPPAQGIMPAAPGDGPECLRAAGVSKVLRKPLAAHHRREPRPAPAVSWQCQEHRHVGRGRYRPRDGGMTRPARGRFPPYPDSAPPDTSAQPRFLANQAAAARQRSIRLSRSWPK